MQNGHSLPTKPVRTPNRDHVVGVRDLVDQVVIRGSCGGFGGVVSDDHVALGKRPVRFVVVAMSRLDGVEITDLTAYCVNKDWLWLDANDVAAVK